MASIVAGCALGGRWLTSLNSASLLTLFGGRQDPAESGIQIVVSKTFNFILRSFRFLNVLETVGVLIGAKIALAIVSCIGSEPDHDADQDCDPYPGGDQLRL
jgi:Na+-translocating ferredoxin:NAD+ oxidoreductase RnfG subunit